MSAALKNRIFSIGTLVLALYLGYEAFSYPPESALFPRALAVVMGGLGALFLLRQILGAKKKAVVKAPPASNCSVELDSGGDISALKSAGLVFGSIGLYSLFVGLVNYEAATVIFLATMMLVLRFPKKRWIIVIACGLMALLWAIFFHLLGVTRPESLFFV